jgi:hypothetical protein
MPGKKKRGFYPPQNFEENISDFATMITDATKPWGGKVTGCTPSEIDALRAALNDYVPLRQKFEQSRLAYEEAKEKYLEAGRALWEKFYTSLQYARTYSRKDTILSQALKKYGKTYTRKVAPAQPK